MSQRPGHQKADAAPVLLIGGTGFIGSAVARRLSSAGVPLRCLVRPTSRRERLEGVAFEPVEGDIRDPDSLARALEGCRAVIHLASPSAWSEIDSPRLDEVVIEGTRTLLGVAAEQGRPRVVYVSSITALGGTERPEVLDEESPFGLADPSLRYAHAKRAAEELCREAAADGLEVVVVNPAETYGPGDLDLITAGSLVDFASGPVALVTDGGASVAHVDDVAAGIVAALEAGRAGERYILGGENLTVRRLAELTRELLGRSPLVISVPRGLLRGLGRASLRLGLPLPLEPRVIPYATRYWYADSGKARRELGYAPRDVREVLVPTLAWLREAEHLPP